jgi:hypothetical protein
MRLSIVLAYAQCGRWSEINGSYIIWKSCHIIKIWTTSWWPIYLENDIQQIILIYYFNVAISMETNVFWNTKKWLSISSPFQRYKNIDIEYNEYDAFIRYMFDHSQYIEKPNNLCLCEEENERALTGKQWQIHRKIFKTWNLPVIVNVIQRLSRTCMANMIYVICHSTLDVDDYLRFQKERIKCLQDNYHNITYE